LWVNNCTKKGSNFSTGGTVELVVQGCFPGGVWHVVNILNVLLEINGHLSKKELGNRLGCAELEVSAGKLGIVKVDKLVTAVELLDSLLKLGEKFVEVS
jgi:hypothetical protein